MEGEETAFNSEVSIIGILLCCGRKIEYVLEIGVHIGYPNLAIFLGIHT